MTGNWASTVNREMESKIATDERSNDRRHIEGPCKRLSDIIVKFITADNRNDIVAMNTTNNNDKI